ncbi:MAG: DUF86 domain-containing protein [Clostridia bacterium]|nr:DUF86 domain-containing protein [Clostridia bacterium]
MDERLLYQLNLLDKYILNLDELAQTPLEKYLNDIILQGAAERFLQLAVETCLNIGNRILALEQRKRNITAPETYAEIFERLSQIGIIPISDTPNLINMAKFRNLLVHMYWEVDPKKVHSILTGGIQDLKTYRSYIVRYIKNPS